MQVSAGQQTIKEGGGYGPHMNVRLARSFGDPTAKQGVDAQTASLGAQQRACRDGNGYCAGNAWFDRHGHAVEKARHQCLQAQSGARVLIEIARSEEHTSELQSLMRISYAVFCLK